MSDQRVSVEAWKNGNAYIFNNRNDRPDNRPVWWDGDNTKDPLRFISGRMPGIGYFTSGEVVIAVNEDRRPWPGNPSFVGVDCVYNDKKVWVLVDTAHGRNEATFGFSIEELVY